MSGMQQYLATLPRCQRCRNFPPHPAAAHRELRVALLVISDALAHGDVATARHWVVSARQLEHAQPPREVKRAGRPVLLVIQGGQLP